MPIRVEALNHASFSALSCLLMAPDSGGGVDRHEELRIKAKLRRKWPLDWYLAAAVRFVSRPNSELAAYVEILRERFMPKGSQVIAVHIRRQDKRRAGFKGSKSKTHHIEAERYTRGVSLLMSNYTSGVFVSSDEQRAIAEFQNAQSKTVEFKIKTVTLPKQLFLPSGFQTNPKRNTLSNEAARTVSWRYSPEAAMNSSSCPDFSELRRILAAFSNTKENLAGRPAVHDKFLKGTGTEQASTRRETQYRPKDDECLPAFDESFSLMAQVFLMSEARAFIFTSTSNVGRMVRLLAMARLARGRPNSMKFLDLDGCKQSQEYYGCPWTQPPITACRWRDSSPDIEDHASCTRDTNGNGMNTLIKQSDDVTKRCVAALFETL